MHRSPWTLQETETTSSRATLPYCIVGTFGLMHMWLDHVPCGFILQSDWLLKILWGNGRQKMDGNATRHLSWFFGRDLWMRLGSGDETNLYIALYNEYEYCSLCICLPPSECGRDCCWSVNCRICAVCDPPHHHLCCHLGLCCCFC